MAKARIKQVIIIFCYVFLVSCQSKDDITEYMLGSWEGKADGGSWCASYERDGANVSALIFSKKPESKEGTDKQFIVNRSEGYLIINRGMRFMLNVAKTHNLEGKELSDKQRRVSSGAYLIVKHAPTTFRYRSVKTEQEYENHRVASCADYEIAHQKYLETFTNQ